MAGGDRKIHEHPNAGKGGFQKNPQNINRSGANRKLVSNVNTELEEIGVKETTSAEIKSIYLRLVNLTIPELEEKVSDNSQPALVRVVGKNILSGKGFEIIDKMLDRAIGKAIQQTDITTNGKEINHPPLKPEQIDKLIEKL
jgi:UTP-glucose-1-phosphate uridylyltransferase